MYTCLCNSLIQSLSPHWACSVDAAPQQWPEGGYFGPHLFKPHIHRAATAPPPQNRTLRSSSRATCPCGSHCSQHCMSARRKAALTHNCHLPECHLSQPGQACQNHPPVWLCLIWTVSLDRDVSKWGQSLGVSSCVQNYVTTQRVSGRRTS